MSSLKMVLAQEPTPREVAEWFAEQNSMVQALFISALADITEKWPQEYDFQRVFQWQAIIDEPMLTEDGRCLMREWGQYGEVRPG